MLIFYIALFVGGFNLTKPLDALIDKFEVDVGQKTLGQFSVHKMEASSNDINDPENIVNEAIQLWYDTVEAINPIYFSPMSDDSNSESEGSSVSTPSVSSMQGREVLYDTSLDYLLLIIQKAMFTQPKEGETREDLYLEFQKIKPVLLKKVDEAIEIHGQHNLTYNLISLRNVRRTIEFHFDSENVKILIVSGSMNDEKVLHDLTRVPLYIHMTAAIICLSLSSFFHSFCCYNETANIYLSRLDYGGISFLIAGSCMPPYFYSFY